MVLQKIDQLPLAEDMIMVTADVDFLNTSIRHCDGLRAVTWYLKSNNIDKSLSDLMVTLLEFLLNHNVFMFNSQILQLHGTAMWASCATSYANLFIGAWERKIFQGDTIAEMEKGTEHELETRMQKLNSNEQNIKLCYKCGRTLEFLDIKISASSPGVLHTDVFCKPTATNSFLRADSSHPRSMIKGIPIRQFLRKRRILRRFQQRGYSNRTIRQSYRRTLQTTRNQLLYGSSTKAARKDGEQILPISPSCVARRSPNIKDNLVHTHYDPQKLLLRNNMGGGVFFLVECVKLV
ncbi:unnamed protein product [Ranitomeya imitator]|uniref:Uncharacterized protein n=1 Tax=Ranitomeya imitator TaxID=111125 RepID=A0ABN9M287_9NEOB|nr:unnamed protein product [Ranitomeya imitator]